MSVLGVLCIPPSWQEGVGASWFWWWDLPRYVYRAGGVPSGVRGGGRVMIGRVGPWWAMVSWVGDSGCLAVPGVRVGVVRRREADPPWCGAGVRFLDLHSEVVCLDWWHIYPTTLDLPLQFP